MDKIKLRKKRVYQLSDLRKNDMELMQQACFLQKPYFLCFGMSCYKLSTLGMIDDENNVTVYGYRVTKDYMEKQQ